MPKSVKARLQNGYSVDETDRIPSNMHVSIFDVILYIIAIVGHLVDLAIDINVAVRYYIYGHYTEFGWTLAFIMLPAFVNTAVSIRMYAQDRDQPNSISNQVTKRKILRIFILVFQMAPVLRFMDSLRYALKARRAARNGDVSTQRKYYSLMLKEDSDAALLRVFECFLEAAPQQVLQTTFLLRRYEYFAIHQLLSIVSSIVSMGWCLAAYQRAIRFAQEDKFNMTWLGTALQIGWHFLVTSSRIMALTVVSFLYPQWAVLACVVHTFVMAIWLQFFDRSPFCSHNRFYELAFSIIMGLVYIFTYIIPVEGNTRYRFALYYTVCLIENVACAVLWYIAAEDWRYTWIFYLVLGLCIIPYAVGLLLMIMYYAFFHPKLKSGLEKNGATMMRYSIRRPDDVINGCP